REPVKFVACDTTEAHSIADLQARGRVVRWAKHAQRRASDQLPTTRRVVRINARLSAGKSHGSGTDVFFRRRQTRNLQWSGHASKISKAGREAEEVNEVIAPGVQRNHLLRG